MKMISGMLVGGETKLLGKTFSSALEINEREDDHLCIYIYIYIQGVPGGTCQTSGGCFLC
jgi:hypothetical protein